MRNRRPLTPFCLPALALLALFGCGGNGGGDPAPMQPGAPGPFMSPPNDAFYAMQWHLQNNGTVGTAGEDCKAEAAWAMMTGAPAEPVSGRGVRIVVIDDGMQQLHEDLGGNAVIGAGGSYDGGGTLVDNDPTPADPNSDHGTSCAGVAAGIGHNMVGISGVAPRASLVGLEDAGTTASQAMAMTKDIGANHVYNMSYGPDENGYYTLTDMLERNAITTGIMTGRGGRGVVYVRAAGNGGNPTGVGADPMQPNRWGHHTNLDGFNNEFGVIVVGAVDAAGTSPAYNQCGACLTCCGHSNGPPGGITTTSIAGSGNADLAGPYTSMFGGTSSAAPLVVGVVALMLQANPMLTWRDVRRILANTSRQNDAGDAGWAANGAGQMVHHKYGYGAVDAGAAVAAAVGFATLGPSVIAPNASPATVVNMAIPDNMPAGIMSMNTVAGAPMSTDQIVLRLTLNTTNLRDHRVTLTSPAGTVSVLLEPQALKDGPVPGGETGNLGLNGEIRLATVFTMGENPNGMWTLTVSDQVAGRANTATLVSWFLDVYAD